MTNRNRQTHLQQYWSVHILYKNSWHEKENKLRQYLCSMRCCHVFWYTKLKAWNSRFTFLAFFNVLFPQDLWVEAIVVLDAVFSSESSRRFKSSVSRKISSSSSSSTCFTSSHTLSSGRSVFIFSTISLMRTRSSAENRQSWNKRSRRLRMTTLVGKYIRLSRSGGSLL